MLSVPHIYQSPLQLLTLNGFQYTSAHFISSQSCIKLNNQQRQNQFYVEHDQRLRDNEDNYRQQLAEQNRLFKSRLEWATNTHRSFSDALHNDFLLSYQQSVQELATSLNGENDRLRRTIEQMRFDLDAAQQALLVISTPFSRSLPIGNPSQLTIN